MKNDDDARSRVDAKQCELLIGLACNAEKPSSAAPATTSPRQVARSEAKVDRTQRDSLTEAMVGLILGPDAF